MTIVEIRGATADAKADKKLARKAVKRTRRAYRKASRLHRAVKKFNKLGLGDELSAKLQGTLHDKKGAAKTSYNAARSLWHDAKANIGLAQMARSNDPEFQQTRRQVKVGAEVYGVHHVSK
jgi:hypothetical protein